MTHRLLGSTAILAAALTLSGCDWFKGVTGSSDTKMENVEILPGTASDEMITLDAASGDGTAIDTSTAIGPPLPGAADADADADDSDDAADGDGPAAPVSNVDEPETQPGDVVIRPPAGRADAEAPAKK